MLTVIICPLALTVVTNVEHNTPRPLREKEEEEWANRQRSTEVFWFPRTTRNWPTRVDNGPNADNKGFTEQLGLALEVAFSFDRVIQIKIRVVRSAQIEH